MRVKITGFCFTFKLFLKKSMHAKWQSIYTSSN